MQRWVWIKEVPSEQNWVEINCCVLSSLQSDKLCKAFSYVDAAMYFVESGIAMEKDPQISMSSYTMFAETVELLK